MKTLYIVLLSVAAVFFLASATITGYSIDNKGPALDEKPYESDICDAEKTVCSDGELVKIYDIEEEGIVSTWTNEQEHDGPYKVSGSALRPVGYECYKYAAAKSGVTLYAGIACVVLSLGAIGFLLFWCMRKGEL